jgi:hypothetical protein
MRIPFKTLLLLLCLGTGLFAQTGNEIRSKILSTIPNVELENKILFINVWKSSDFESRENTKEFLRVANIYKQAKLKNGLKGVTFINISLDDNVQTWSISVQKDGLQTDYNFENTSGKYSDVLQLLNNKAGSLVINTNGDVLATDLKKDDCFPLFRSQITR